MFTKKIMYMQISVGVSHFHSPRSNTGQDLFIYLSIYLFIIYSSTTSIHYFIHMMYMCMY